MLAVNVTLSPSQKTVGPPAKITEAGFGLTVIVIGAEVPEHPLLSVTVTL